MTFPQYGVVPLANFDDRPDAAERQARAWATYQPARPVGSAFEYSNVNYSLLGLVIEAVGGETYEAYIQHHIFDPLEMRHSHTSKAAAQRDGLAVGHRSWFVTPVPVPNLPIDISGLTLLGSPLRRSLLLYMPDLSWLVLLSGGFAGLWTFLRAGLILRTLRKPQASKTLREDTAS